MAPKLVSAAHMYFFFFHLSLSHIFDFIVDIKCWDASVSKACLDRWSGHALFFRGRTPMLVGVVRMGRRGWGGAEGRGQWMGVL